MVSCLSTIDVKSYCLEADFIYHKGWQESKQVLKLKRLLNFPKFLNKSCKNCGFYICIIYLFDYYFVIYIFILYIYPHISSYPDKIYIFVIVIICIIYSSEIIHFFFLIQHMNAGKVIYFMVEFYLYL